MRSLKIVLMSVLVITLLVHTFENAWGIGRDQFSTNQSFGDPNFGTFNLQIQAIEVTQGVRGEIPTRVPPDDDLAFLPDGAVHVANRRTIVRVYPWVSGSSEVMLPPITARLWAYRDGLLLSSSPLSPVNDNLNISPAWDLETMRRDAQKSWNFVLPSAWISNSLEFKSFALRFVVEINPPGPNHQPECQGCGTDNRVTLGGQEFVTVPTLIIQPYFVEHTVTDLKKDQVTYPGPTVDEFEAMMRTFHSMLPVGDRDRGLTILHPIEVEWKGPLYENERHVFPETMIIEYLPGGQLAKSRDGIIHVFLFSASSNHDFLVYNNSGGMWINLAWTGKSYAQCAARGWDMAHELTHGIGLSHAGNQNGESTMNSDYPDAYGRVERGAYGFDIWEMQVIPPFAADGETHDYMSYNQDTPTWVSIYTWKAVASLLGQPDLDI